MQTKRPKNAYLNVLQTIGPFNHRENVYSFVPLGSLPRIQHRNVFKNAQLPIHMQTH